MFNTLRQANPYLSISSDDNITTIHTRSNSSSSTISSTWSISNSPTSMNTPQTFQKVRIPPIMLPIHDWCKVAKDVISLVPRKLNSKISKQFHQTTSRLIDSFRLIQNTFSLPNDRTLKNLLRDWRQVRAYVSRSTTSDNFLKKEASSHVMVTLVTTRAKKCSNSNLYFTL